MNIPFRKAIRELASAAVAAIEESDPRLSADAITEAQRVELKRLGDETSGKREALALYIREGLEAYAGKHELSTVSSVEQFQTLHRQLETILNEKDVTSYAVNNLLEERGLMPQQTTDMVRMQRDDAAEQEINRARRLMYEAKLARDKAEQEALQAAAQELPPMDTKPMGMPARQILTGRVLGGRSPSPSQPMAQA